MALFERFNAPIAHDPLCQKLQLHFQKILHSKGDWTLALATFYLDGCHGSAVGDWYSV
jgi:hypothetical protein